MLLMRWHVWLCPDAVNILTGCWPYLCGADAMNMVDCMSFMAAACTHE